MQTGLQLRWGGVVEGGGWFDLAQTCLRVGRRVGGGGGVAFILCRMLRVGGVGAVLQSEMGFQYPPAEASQEEVTTNSELFYATLKKVE